MAKLMTFVDVDGNNLFSAPADVLPRPGDVVNFSHEARDGEKWNTEAWEESLDISGAEWTVVSVLHDFRRISIDSTAHVVFVVLDKEKALRRGLGRESLGCQHRG